jgi:hypothetical protein
MQDEQPFQTAGHIEVFRPLNEVYNTTIDRQPGILTACDSVFLSTFSSTDIWFYVSTDFNFNIFDMLCSFSRCTPKQWWNFVPR